MKRSFFTSLSISIVGCNLYPSKLIQANEMLNYWIVWTLSLAVKCVYSRMGVTDYGVCEKRAEELLSLPPIAVPPLSGVLHDFYCFRS